MQTDEALTPEEALALFTSPLESPGTPRGPLEPGQAADLVVLDRPWHAARARLDAGDVSATLIAGHPVFRRD
jgi:predicted amidohydrolase YtcJ